MSETENLTCIQRHYELLRREDIRVVLDGFAEDAELIHCREDAPRGRAVRPAGKDDSATLIVSSVWVNINGEWKSALYHETKVESQLKQ